MYISQFKMYLLWAKLQPGKQLLQENYPWNLNVKEFHFSFQTLYCDYTIKTGKCFIDLSILRYKQH